MRAVRYGDMRKPNPHPLLIDEESDACPWCDGTGLHGRRLHFDKGHHPGCSFMALDADGNPYETGCDGSVEWVPCPMCDATGKRAA